MAYSFELVGDFKSAVTEYQSILHSFSNGPKPNPEQPDSHFGLELTAQIRLAICSAKQKVQGQSIEDDELIKRIKDCQSFESNLQSKRGQADLTREVMLLSAQLQDTKKSAAQSWVHMLRLIELDPSHECIPQDLTTLRSKFGPENLPSLLAPLSLYVIAQRRNERLNSQVCLQIANLVREADGANESLDLFKLAIELDPESTSAKLELATLYSQSADWDQAAVILEEALECRAGPEELAEVQFYLAQVEQERNEPATAILHYFAAGRGGFLPAQSFSAAYNLAKKSGSKAQQIDALEELIPHSDAEQRSDICCEIANIRPEDHDFAQQRLREAVELNPANVAARLQLHLLSPNHKSVLNEGITYFRSLPRLPYSANHFSFALTPFEDTEINTTIEIPLRPLIHRLSVLFEAQGDADAVYLAQKVLSQLSEADSTATENRTPSQQLSWSCEPPLQSTCAPEDPWPLPAFSDASAEHELNVDLLSQLDCMPLTTASVSKISKYLAQLSIEELPNWIENEIEALPLEQRNPQACADLARRLFKDLVTPNPDESAFGVLDSAELDWLRAVEDRYALLASADPEPIVSALLTLQGTEANFRWNAFLRFLFSEEHLELRRTLGYRVNFELSDDDLEVVQ